jgi:acyl-CoA synthetase (AMP-forming)/AMP-acid ligase II
MEYECQMANLMVETTNEKSKHIFHGPKDPPLRDWITAQLLNYGAELYPQRAAIVASWQSKRLTYQELKEETKDLMRTLRSFGVKQGDRVVVLAGNSLEFVLLFLAITSLGAIFVIVNPTFTAKEVIDAVKLVGEFSSTSKN